ncbi:hypothetical protein NM208_g2889 [Fusarium decemcellulare]|uniref:Uncharacterized protein n=1 Tax=Fusarium decemcellulare TaxID=57161 RepID=A0ACC1SRB2_9HYPO|nr:hypothetical protein NM208_g2889 [Fusarium decemcellulare]
MSDQFAVESAAAETSTPVAPQQATPPPQNELVAADDNSDDGSQDDVDSSLGSDTESSTASVSTSILEYRRSQGRTYHSDKFTTNYFIPNDDQQLESIDLTHHYLTILLDDQLFLAPLQEKQIRKVLDVGTGTVHEVSGRCTSAKYPRLARLLTHRSEFADRYPHAEIVGTDLSPCQPDWVPPNVRFEIDDAVLNWTWEPDEFDFIHIRYLFGAIKDWSALLRQAYRCCVPGGWVQSAEADVEFRSDDGTIDREPNLKLYKKLFEEGGKALGISFFVYDEQVKAFEEAGFVDIKTVDYKIPVGSWPKDPKLAEVGKFVRATMENDIEGYTLMMWQDVLQWPKDEYQLFLMSIRKAMRDRKIHTYMRQTATGVARHALQLPDSDPQDPVVDLVVADAEVPQLAEKIGRLVRRENHADVYSVHDPDSGFMWPFLEARAFILDGIPPKLKRYRKRCIKRLESRVWLQCWCCGAFLVVYLTDSLSKRSIYDKSDGDANGAGEEDDVVEPSEPDRPQKTAFGREAARIRQLERRRARRRRNKSARNPSPSRASDEKPSARERTEPEAPNAFHDDSVFRASILLYLAYDEEGELRSLAPLNLPEVFINTPTMRAWVNSLENHRLCLTGDLKDLEDISWAYNTRMDLLEELQVKVSKMEYRQLFSGIHFALSRQADAGALSVLIKGTSPRREVLQHVREVLPLVVDDVQEACIEIYEKFGELNARLASTAEVERRRQQRLDKRFRLIAYFQVGMIILLVLYNMSLVGGREAWL